MREFKDILQEKVLLFEPPADDINKLRLLYKKFKGKSKLNTVPNINVVDNMSNLDTGNIFDGDRRLHISFLNTNHITFFDDRNIKNVTIKDIEKEIEVLKKDMERLKDMIKFMKEASKINASFPHFGV